MNGRVALGVWLLAARIGWGQASGQPQVTYTILHQFSDTCADGNGCNPGWLIPGQDGNFYGTTEGSNVTTAGGMGTVYQLSTSGGFRLIHAFMGGADGDKPAGPLAIDSAGNIYGSTWGNTTFQLARDGTYTSFGFLPGMLPNANTAQANGLVYASDGNLYGTTIQGGPGGAAILFRLTTSGTMTVVHTFDPQAEGTPSLLVPGTDGMLYGILHGGRPGVEFVRATLDGVITQIANVQSAGVLAGQLPEVGPTLGSDGNFYANGTDIVVQMTPSGTVTKSQSVGIIDGTSPLISASDGNLYCASGYALYQITTGLTSTLIYQFPRDATGSTVAVSALAQGPDALYGTQGNAVFKLAAGGPNGLPPPPSGPASISGITLLDPVPDLVTPASVAGTPSGLVADANVLATGGRNVVGVAADGVSRVLLRATGTSPLTFSILDENMNAVTLAGQYGALASPVGAGSAFSISTTVQPVMVNGQSMVFVVYKSPVDFVRSDPLLGVTDQKNASRTINIQVKAADGTVLATSGVTIVRPPVILVHGFTSSPQFWSSFTPLMNACSASTVSADPRFFIECADYSRAVPGVQTFEPNYLNTAGTLLEIQPLKQNVLGYAYNAQVVFGQIQNMLVMYTQNCPQAGNKPIAAVQVDAVGHSMGGLIVRMMPYALTAPPAYFREAPNFAQGVIHKLITIGSPHLGSPLSTAALDPLNVCSWFAAAAMGEYPLQSATIAGYASPVSGGAADLVGDGQGKCISPALAQLQGNDDKQMPVALIAGQMSDAQLASLSFSRQSIGIHVILTSPLVALACATDYVMFDYSSSGWLTLTGTSQANQSDAVVPVTSAFDGLTPSPGCAIVMSQTPEQPPCHATEVQYAVHGPGTVSEVGFMGPSLLDAMTGTPLETINLLNASVSSPAFATLPSYPGTMSGVCR